MTDFNDLIWLPDRMLLDKWIFRLEHSAGEVWAGEEHFRFFKTRDLMDQYARFWMAQRALAPDYRAHHVLELGIWDGASAALWCDLLLPDKLVAIDCSLRADGDYFERFRRERGHEGRLRTIWGTDQADEAALLNILACEFENRLDLVIDDASHDLEATKASFELLFPFLHAGGFYVIEDWSWPHWYDFQPPEHPWARKAPLSRFAEELVRCAGTTLDEGPKLIEAMTIQKDLLVIERGSRPLHPDRAFRLSDYCLIRRQDRPDHTV